MQRNRIKIKIKNKWLWTTSWRFRVMAENFNPAKPRTKKINSLATEQELNPDLLIAIPTRSRFLLAEA